MHGQDDVQFAQNYLQDHNFYDGNLYAERDTGGVGIGTTIANLTPWKEQFLLAKT